MKNRTNETSASPAESRVAVPKKRSPFVKKLLGRENRTAWTLLSFPVLWWGIFFLYAFFRAIYFSFTDMRFSVDQISVFNFDNYIRLFGDEVFYKALGNTAVWTVVMTLFNNALGMLFAFLIFKMKRGKKIFLSLLFWPTLVSAVVGSEITKMIFNPSDTGFMNSIITYFGGEPLGWYNDPDIALVTLMIIPSLLGFSTQMMIYYVALMGVPDSYVEAARLETNSSWVIFWKIYFPLIKNAITYNLLLSLIGNLKVMGPMQLVSDNGQGGPLNSTVTIMLYLYNKGIAGYEMGYACAIGVITLLIVLIISGIQLKLTGEGAVDYE